MNFTPILAIQLCRFSNQNGQLVKDETVVSCTQTCQLGQYLTVPITIDNEVSFMNEYSLIATNNHSGTLNREHYWASMKIYVHVLGILAMPYLILFPESTEMNSDKKSAS